MRAPWARPPPRGALGAGHIVNGGREKGLGRERRGCRPFSASADPPSLFSTKLVPPPALPRWPHTFGGMRAISGAWLGQEVGKTEKKAEVSFKLQRKFHGLEGRVPGERRAWGEGIRPSRSPGARFRHPSGGGERRPRDLQWNPMRRVWREGQRMGPWEEEELHFK